MNDIDRLAQDATVLDLLHHIHYEVPVGRLLSRVGQATVVSPLVGVLVDDVDAELRISVKDNGAALRSILEGYQDGLRVRANSD